MTIVKTYYYQSAGKIVCVMLSDREPLVLHVYVMLLSEFVVV